MAASRDLHRILAFTRPDSALFSIKPWLGRQGGGLTTRRSFSGPSHGHQPRAYPVLANDRGCLPSPDRGAREGVIWIELWLVITLFGFGLYG